MKRLERPEAGGDGPPIGRKPLAQPGIKGRVPWSILGGTVYDGAYGVAEESVVIGRVIGTTRCASSGMPAPCMLVDEGEISRHVELEVGRRQLVEEEDQPAPVQSMLIACACVTVLAGRADGRCRRRHRRDERLRIRRRSSG